ncbi:hypothetical protein BDZ88DRAFT_420892 [Geranomyces variabilis]|nr:hypothetical protein BDZ88DRAFT_420892 [Geranomyces variabilis]KAJ3138385.1 hypothetical protein HDU90_001348 [Geranomyces variabilis]
MDLLSRYYFVDQIVDHLWEELVVNLDTCTYLRLALVNSTFKAVVYQSRRRRELLRAHAAAMLLADYHRLALRKPFSNPVLPALDCIARLATTNDWDPRFRKLDVLLVNYGKHLATLLPIAQRINGSLPSVNVQVLGIVHASRMKKIITRSGKEVFFLSDFHFPRDLPDHLAHDFSTPWLFALIVRDEEWGGGFIAEGPFPLSDDEGGEDSAADHELPYPTEFFDWELSPHFQ